MKVKQSVQHKETLDVIITLKELEAIVRNQMPGVFDHFDIDSLWGDGSTLPLSEDITLRFIKAYKHDGVDIG